MAVVYDEVALGRMFLPVGEMLQIQRITGVTDGNIIGEKDVSKDEWVFPLHFPGDPIFPGSLIVEGAGQLIAIWGWHSGLRGKPRLVKVSAEFKSPVTSDDRILTYEGTMSRRQTLIVGRVEVAVAGRHVATVSGSIIVVPK